jgi:hypothetical protein
MSCKLLFVLSGYWREVFQLQVEKNLFLINKIIMGHSIGKVG